MFIDFIKLYSVSVHMSCIFHAFVKMFGEEEEAEEPPEAVLRQACPLSKSSRTEVTEMVSPLENSYITVDLAETSTGHRFQSFFMLFP